MASTPSLKDSSRVFRIVLCTPQQQPLVRLRSVMIDSVSRGRGILRNTPQHAAWIDQGEIAHTPRLVNRLPHSRVETTGEIRNDDLRMPVIDIFHQQMHLEICAERRLAECLQQEAASAEANVGQAVIGPGNVKPKRKVELFRSLKISRGNKGFRFHSREIHRASVFCSN